MDSHKKITEGATGTRGKVKKSRTEIRKIQETAPTFEKDESISKIEGEQNA